MLIEELKARKLIQDQTDILPHDGCVYFGMDSTKKSIHIGYLLPLNILRIMKQNGYKVIILLGTATTLIGDPTWKTKSRPMLSEEEIFSNANSISKQIKSLLEPDYVLYNHHWLSDMNIIHFLRNFGTKFSVNKLIKTDTFKTRLDNGNNLSFLEFTYPLMQSYDFLYLNENYSCSVQLGGSDQWFNITQGVELVRKVSNKHVVGITSPLLTNSDGTKIGKTDKGAMYLDPDLVTPYDMWQFLRNVDDADVKKLLLQITDIPTKDIDSICNSYDINEAKKILANNVVAWIYGSDIASNACKKAHNVFEEDGVESEYRIHSDNAYLTNVLCATCLTQSISEAKRLIRGNAISVNGNRVHDVKYRFAIGSNTLLLGKKRKFKIVVAHKN